MKSNKKFPPALGAIVEQALKDNTAWIGKTVLELTCEAIRKRDLSQEDVEGMVCLTVDEEIKHLKREIAQLKKEQERDNLDIKRLEERYKNLTYSVLEVGTEKCDE